MCTITSIVYIGGRQIIGFDALSTDVKPLNAADSNIEITNGSTLFTMDTGQYFKFDQENNKWWEV